VGDTFAVAELDESVHRACGLHTHNRCAKAPRKRHVPSKRVAVSGDNAIGTLFRRLDATAYKPPPTLLLSCRHARRGASALELMQTMTRSGPDTPRLPARSQFAAEAFSVTVVAISSMIQFGTCQAMRLRPRPSTLRTSPSRAGSVGHSFTERTTPPCCSATRDCGPPRSAVTRMAQPDGHERNVAS